MSKIETTPYSGLAIQRTNMRMNKLTHTMREVRIFTEANKDITVSDLTKLLYPAWEELTLDEFEGKEWYVEEKLLPLLKKDPTLVYQEALDEEQAKLLSIEDATKAFTW